MTTESSDSDGAQGAGGDPFRVMVVDDSAVIRGLLTRSLEADHSIKVVASVGNGEVALKSLERHDVEVIILDIEMPVMDGLTALPKLLAAQPGVKVVMASALTRKNAEVSLRALQMGAADYVTKPSSKSELTSADTFQRELTGKVKPWPRRPAAVARKQWRSSSPWRRVPRRHRSPAGPSTETERSSCAARLW